MLLESYIRSYLEIPVVLGIGLCQSSAIKSLYFKDQIHDSPEKYTLTSQIRKILTNVPSDLDFFEAPVSNYYIYLLDLPNNHKFLTLVLHENNVIKAFRSKQIQQKLQIDLDSTIQLFKDIANDRSLGGKLLSNGQQSHLDSPGIAENAAISAPQDSIEIADFLLGMNTLSRFVRQYVGPKILSNYWNLSRPDREWLLQFEIKRSGAIVYRGVQSDQINPLQMLLLREWTQNFMNQCNAVIRDLPELFEKSDLSEKHRKLLSIYTSSYLQESTVREKSSESLFGDVFLEVNQQYSTTD